MSQSLPFDLITTPSERWLTESLRNCQKRLWVASPYVTGIMLDVFGGLPSSVERRLLTTMTLRNYAQGGSDAKVIKKLHQSGVKISKLAGLHAKAYVVDSSVALVTSANATHSGMRRNWECGVASADPLFVRSVAEQIRHGFGALEKPTPIEDDEVSLLIKLVPILRQGGGKMLQYGLHEAERPKFILPPGSTERQALTGKLSGWRGFVFECVLKMPNDEFTTAEFTERWLSAAKEFKSTNNRVPDKFRQQLQELRDLGFIEFVDNKGKYRRLVAEE